MHHQVSVGQTAVDLRNAIDVQDVPCRRREKLVSAVAGADGYGQRIHLGLLHKVHRLIPGR
jgi:hypothetical protein